MTPEREQEIREADRTWEFAGIPHYRSDDDLFIATRQRRELLALVDELRAELGAASKAEMSDERSHLRRAKELLRMAGVDLSPIRELAAARAEGFREGVEAAARVVDKLRTDRANMSGGWLFVAAWEDAASGIRKLQPPSPAAKQPAERR